MSGRYFEKAGRWIKALLATLLLTCVQLQSAVAATEEELSEQAVDHLCAQMLHSNCDASQQEFLAEFLRDLELFSMTEKLETFDGDQPAFSALPKDQFGMVNWNKAVSDGIIRPLGSLTGEEAEYEGFLENLILFQVDVHFMADVIFPHGMHTYWVGCDSCHPKPFEKKAGATRFTMQDVVKGEFCGKCHGTVAFPPGAYKNCRRCHAITKNIVKSDVGK